MVLFVMACPAHASQLGPLTVPALQTREVVMQETNAGEN